VDCRVSCCSVWGGRGARLHPPSSQAPAKITKCRSSIFSVVVPSTLLMCHQVSYVVWYHNMVSKDRALDLDWILDWVQHQYVRPANTSLD
jgi:hypothetical protein